MPFVVYILRTSENTLYIGQTANLARRLKDHHSKTARSAKYLRRFASHKLVYQEEYQTRSEAMKRESTLKTWPKSKKERLISASNST